jgi:hypothetical protein
LKPSIALSSRTPHGYHTLNGIHCHRLYRQLPTPGKTSEAGITDPADEVVPPEDDRENGPGLERVLRIIDQHEDLLYLSLQKHLAGGSGMDGWCAASPEI